MFIQTEETPNQNCLKFLVGREICPPPAKEFRTKEDALAAPLAHALLMLNGVESVMFSLDFISVTKTPDADWYLLKPHIIGTIVEYFVAGRPILVEMSAKSDIILEEDNEIVGQIKEILDTRVRPAVALDGGDIVFSRFENGVVYLRMKGACSGCPSSTATLKSGIENMLRFYVPEVEEVCAENDDAPLTLAHS